TVTLTETAPVSDKHGFQITDGQTDSPSGITVSHTDANPSSVAVTFAGVPGAGETVEIELTEPGNTTRKLVLTAVTGKAGAGQFTIGATPEETAANFSRAL